MGIVRAAADYWAMLRALLPVGKVWRHALDATINKLLLAWADELARAELRCHQLVDEFDPRTTSELLPDWERVAGLPDPCVTAAQSIEARRAALVSKLIYSGGQTPAYFIALAAEMGYPGATIDEYPNIPGNTNRHAWRINIPSQAPVINHFTADSDCDDWLRDWGDFRDQALECRLHFFKPAHTQLIIRYI